MTGTAGRSTPNQAELVITSSTLGNPPFPELVDAAGAAGFDGLSIWPAHDYQRARTQGLSDRDLRTLLDDHGLVVRDVDCAVAWAGADDPRPPYFEESSLDLLLRSAEALGARNANVLLIGRRNATERQAAEALARLGERLAPLVDRLGIRPVARRMADNVRTLQEAAHDRTA